MKKIKKLMGVMFAIMMVFMLATPAFAAGIAEKKPTITINNAKPNETYKAYRLFDLSLDATATKYGYTLNKAWEDFFTTGEGAKFVNIDAENGNVTLKDIEPDKQEVYMQELAQLAKAYAERNPSIVADAEITTKENETSVIFEQLPLGYYVVSTTLGGLCALDTTNPTTEIYEKNQEPTISKSADKTNAAYGETVHYKIPFTRGGYIWGDYIITDRMTGLDMTADQQAGVTIKLKGQEQTIDTGWTKVYTPGVPSNTLIVTISADFLKGYKPGTEFLLEYDATAKKTVSMDNEVIMDYKNGPNVDAQTPPYKVNVANYEFTVKKTDGKEVLNGATFGLYTDEKCTEENRMYFIQTESVYRLAEKYLNNTVENGAITTITAGQAKIEGLAAGTYYLKEIEAPAGYNKLVKPVKIEIIANLNKTSSLPQFKDSAFNEDGSRIDPTIKVNGKDVTKEGNEFILTVINKTGTELPSTGGVGTTMFYVAGGVLILAAVVVLMVKKRMNH